MKLLLKKLKTSATHLNALNQFCIDNSPAYKAMHRKMTRLTSYHDMAELFYPPLNTRQMALFDFFYYVVVGRPWWVASNSLEGKADYIRFVLYVANLLCMQEHLASANPVFRKKLLNHMERLELADFFQSPDDRTAYSHCKKNKKFIKANRRDPDYVIIDGLLPKSIGNVIELIVYASLLQSDFGFPILLQLQQRLMMKETEIVSPDLILITRDGKAIGVEIGSGTGQFSLRDSKIRQINEFVSQTKLPSLTALVPLPYRCPECDEWILFCDQVIDEFALGRKPKKKDYRRCVSCPRFEGGLCPDIIYYGRTKKGGQVLHHHLRCVRKARYVRSLLKEKTQKKERLINYYPHFKGLEGFERRT